jgi:hypothetical protein
MGKENARQLTLPGLAAAALASLALASALAGCTNVASYTQPTLVRVIDASYAAPAINVIVEGTLIAGNVGQGTISPYATLTANTSAPVKIAAASTGDTLTSASSNPLLAGHQYSVFLTDLANTTSGYTVSVITDQQTSAPAGHSAFRFLNQATKNGAVDVYMVPSDSTLDKSIPIVSNLPVGGSLNYIDFASQTVTMIVTPTGKVTPKYTSTILYLGGGEVRTVLLVDAQLTSDPPIQAYFANDVN